MKRDFEHISYPESERLARLENRAAKLERMLSGVYPGQPTADHETSERGTIRRRHVQRGAGRDTGYQGATRSDARDGEDALGDPGYRRGARAEGRGADAGNHAPLGRRGAPEPQPRWTERGRGAAQAQPHHPAHAQPGAPGDHARDEGRWGSQSGYREPETGYSGGGGGYREASSQFRATQAGYRDWPEGHDDPDEGYDEPDDSYDGPDDGYDEPDDAYDEDGYDEPDDAYDEDGYDAPDDDHAPGAGYAGADTGYHMAGGGYRDSAAYHVAGPPGYGAGFAGAQPHGYGAAAGAERADERTAVLIDRGRRHARPTGLRRWSKHWRAIVICAVAALAGAIALAVILSGSSASWPASVAVVQREITVACQNQNVVSEPSQVNFACAKDTSQILWVFSLLTSGDNPNFSDRGTGRQGLEPITPAQGGDVAWSLNLHHPYDPANPTDSLEVAARAINDIIGGATLTGSNGTPVVQPGLESSASNCARYTGSSALVTHQGFPAICAQPVTSPFGQAALVSDVFRQWMLGTSSQVADDAGVLFENANNPGDPQVQFILNSLTQTRL
jgi:hypothetical protein